jgi:NAD(P)-dependent dehydrogenase (short-subunit alcohol dehydrogenase family)
VLAPSPTSPLPAPALLSGRVALVTGAANGLGATIAATLAAAGALGVAVDRDADGAAPPRDWVAHTADVTDEDALRGAVAAAVARFGRLDVVVANAGVVPPWRETAALDLDEWDAVSAVNVRGVAATIAAAAPVLAASADGGPSIIAMASLNARRAHPRQALYSATKHAVVGIVRATALDLGAHGVRVNAVAPGPIATDALLSRMEQRAADGGPARDEALAAAAADAALGRLATAEEVAATVLFLASDLSSGITGQVLAVDAGIP